MYCSRCGYPVGDGSAFCPRCGAGVAAAAGPSAAMGPAPETEAVSPKSRLVTTLLACPFLMVGVFGVHRFYVGRIRTGVAMLLLGLSPVVCFLLGIVILLLGTPPTEGESESVPGTFWAFTVCYVLAALSGCAAGMWSLVDFILAVSGEFKDAQGRPIKAWENRGDQSVTWRG